MMDRRAQIGRGRSGIPLSWDTQGRLVSVSANGVFAESYQYDALGRRVSTTDGAGTVFHVYEGDQCAADTDASGNLLRSYTWGPGIDDLLAVTVYSQDATNSYYAVKDRLGSVQALVDASGAVVESYTYDAWGNASILTSDLRPLTSSAYGNRYLWQGREYSAATGLYNFRARWYEPQSGRWLSKDPIGLEGGLNLYAFCENNPVNFIDPNGLDVNAVFYRSSGILTVTDNQIPRSTIANNVFSGNGANANNPAAQGIADSGPLPAGQYLIGNAYNKADHSGDNQWYRLYGPNGKGGYSYTEIPVRNPSGKMINRGFFNLHTGRRSDGCVTVKSDVEEDDPNYPTSKEFDSIKKLLDATQPLIYNGSSYRGILIVK